MRHALMLRRCDASSRCAEVTIGRGQRRNYIRQDCGRVAQLENQQDHGSQRAGQRAGVVQEPTPPRSSTTRAPLGDTTNPNPAQTPHHVPETSHPRRHLRGRPRGRYPRPRASQARAPGRPHLRVGGCLQGGRRCGGPRAQRPLGPGPHRRLGGGVPCARGSGGPEGRALHAGPGPRRRGARRHDRRGRGGRREMRREHRAPRSAPGGAPRDRAAGQDARVQEARAGRPRRGGGTARDAALRRRDRARVRRPNRGGRHPQHRPRDRPRRRGPGHAPAELGVVGHYAPDAIHQSAGGAWGGARRLWGPAAVRLDG